MPFTSTFNAQNELTTDGNTLVDDQGDTLIYNAWNELIAVNNTAGTTIALYGYNGLGQRVTSEDTGSPQTQLYYDASDQLIQSHVTNEDLSLQSSFVWSAGSGYQNALVLRDYDFSGDGAIELDERDYALQDADWNVTALVGYQPYPGDANADGTVNNTDLVALLTHDGETVAGGAAVGDFNDDGVVNNTDFVTLLTHYTQSGTGSWQLMERFSYSPYGVMSTYTAAFATRSDFLAWNVGFQGMLEDLPTKLNFTDTRVYEASTGRFLTVDPAHADGMNWYRGMANNPINSTDPIGFWKFIPGMGALMAQLGLGPRASQAQFLLSFRPDAAAFKKMGTCDEINFVQIYMYHHANTTLEGTASLFSKDLVHDQWTIDGDGPYYDNKDAVDPSVGGVAGTLKMNDTPGSDNPALFVTAASWDFETAVVASKGKDKGDVFATITWGFNYWLSGAWDKTVHPKYYLGSVVWSPDNPVIFVPSINAASGAPILDKAGKPETMQLGGLSGKEVYWTYSESTAPPSPQMKTVLDKLFP